MGDEDIETVAISVGRSGYWRRESEGGGYMRGHKGGGLEAAEQYEDTKKNGRTAAGVGRMRNEVPCNLVRRRLA